MDKNRSRSPKKSGGPKIPPGEKSWFQKSGLTPAKAALLGVLGMVMIAVIYTHVVPVIFVPSDHATVAKGKSKSKGRKPAKAVGVAATEDSTKSNIENTEVESEAREHAWEMVELSQVTRHDPFARPAQMASLLTLDAPEEESPAEVAAEMDAGRRQLEAAVKGARTQLASLRSQGVQVIVKHRDQFVAIMGDRTLRVGDEINGFRVVDIRADGIAVEKEVTP